MGEVLSVVRTKVGLAVAGGALLATGVGFGAAASGAIGTQEVADTSSVTSTTAVTTSEAAPSTAAAPSEPAAVAPVEQAPAATVSTMTEPAPAPGPAPDTTSAGSVETMPAPQVNPDGSLPPGWLPPQNPGEPPRAPDPGPPPAEKLPGEDGYTG